MNFRIKELFLEHIGPFELRQFTFPEKKIKDKAEIHIITGENGTGKSTLLTTLASIQRNENILKRFVYKSSMSLARIVFSNNEHIQISGDGKWDYSKSSTIRKYIENIPNFQRAEFEIAFFAYSSFRSVHTSMVSRDFNRVVNPLEGVLDFNSSNNSNLLITYIADLLTKEALAFRKKDELKANQYRESIKQIETSIGAIIGKEIEFNLEDDPLRVELKLDRKSLEFDVLPDGLKSIVSWISDLLMRLDRIPWKDRLPAVERPFVLFLDEIDVHLHPGWQRRILPVIQNLFKNAQIFVSTHSPFVVGSVDNAWIHRLKLNREFWSQNGEPILSEDAKSYESILEETFGISDYYGIEIEKQLDEFKRIRNKFFHNPKAIDQQDIERLQELLISFKDQNSIELRNQVAAEIHQLKNLLGEKFPKDVIL